MRVIVEQGFTAVAMALFFYFFLSGLGWWPVLLPLIGGALVVGYFYYRLREYRQAEQAYYRRRSEVHGRYWESKYS